MNVFRHWVLLACLSAAPLFADERSIDSWPSPLVFRQV